MKLTNMVDTVKRFVSRIPLMFDYREAEHDALSLSFYQVVSLILLISFIFFAIFSPVLIHIAPTDGDIIVSKIKEPFQSYRDILGTDLFGRDLVDVFLIGLNKTYLAGLATVFIHAIVTIPVATVLAYYVKPESFLNKLCEPLTIFPALFLFVIVASIWDASQFVAYLVVFVSTLIFVFYNTFRDVVQVMRMSMIKTLELDGAKLHHLIRIVILPVLTPNFFRLLRRTLIIVVTELITIGVLQINMNPLSTHWGTVIYNAWKYRELNEYSLIVMVFLVSLVLYVSSVGFIILERHFRIRQQYRVHPRTSKKHESTNELAEKAERTTEAITKARQQETDYNAAIASMFK